MLEGERMSIPFLTLTLKCLCVIISTYIELLKSKIATLWTLLAEHGSAQESLPENHERDVNHDRSGFVWREF